MKIMNEATAPSYVAFEGDHRIAAGSAPDVVRAVKQLLSQRRDVSILIFDGATGGSVDIDFRGSVSDVLARFPTTAGPSKPEDAAAVQRGPGRPKLGVIAREVTLLPRHWDWLAQQPGGASVALRRLVEQARRNGSDGNRIRRAQDAAYRFMSAMAGDRPNYEEAVRALFANQAPLFQQMIASWPADIRDYTLTLAEQAFGRETNTGRS